MRAHACNRQVPVHVGSPKQACDKEHCTCAGHTCKQSRGRAQVVDAYLTAGDLSTFIIYALYVGGNVGALAGVISNLIQARAHIAQGSPGLLHPLSSAPASHDAAI